jgi:glycosyltransferase involved in cell wall biosynthesis
MSNNLVIGIYYHPEAYPPTLNAVQVLSGCFDTITMVHRPHLMGSWKYPANVHTIASGKFITSKGQEQSSVTRKAAFFGRFMIDLLRAIRKQKPSVVLLYDVHALYAYTLIKPLVRNKHIAWYHNHDVSELHRERKYSIGWFACKAEKKVFRHLDIFTLPAADRLQYFPVNTLKGEHFVVPNFPSKHFYSAFYSPKQMSDVVRIVFQGRIGEGLGLEEVIALLAEPIRGKQLHLVLMGSYDDWYRQSLEQLAARFHVLSRLTFTGFVLYGELPRLTASCDIGLGIYSKTGTMQMTLGTASNKFYEYAALGLPVIYLNEERFTRYLKQYNWAFAITADSGAIKDAIGNIIDNYEYYSGSAHQSFVQQLNFEEVFKPVTAYLAQHGCCNAGTVGATAKSYHTKQVT